MYMDKINPFKGQFIRDFSGQFFRQFCLPFPALLLSTPNQNISFHIIGRNIPLHLSARYSGRIFDNPDRRRKPGHWSGENRRG
jgi:hypothetical protein